MWILYQIAFGLTLLLAGPFLLLSRGRHYLATLRGRLGGGPPPTSHRPLWIHAVSVGEVGVAATLIRALPPELPLVVTTITPTGQDLALHTLATRASVAYLPFELGFAIRRFFRRFGPSALVLAEGDLWPLVLRRAVRGGLPVVVINGRVSERSFQRMRRLRPFLGPLLGRVDRFGVQGEDDRKRLLDLGVAEGRVTITGNLKYDSADPVPLPELEQCLRRLAGDRGILVAGSTMRGEESAVLDAFAESGGGERALLLLAPRHPERCGDVANLLAGRRLESARRSSLPVEGSPDVILLDTLGELAALYRLAAGAFVGGTLVPTGGHNPLEAARWGVPVAVGPSMENFPDIERRFEETTAWQRVTDARQLGRVWSGWLADPAAARELGARGTAIVEANRGALDRSLALLRPVLERSEGGE